MEAAAFTPPLSAALGLSWRRLATAGNEALGRWRLPFSPPRFPLLSVCLAAGSLPRATRRLAGRRCRPHTPFSAALGFSCKELATAGSVALGRWRQPPSHPRFPLRSECVTDVSVPQATRRLAGGGCRSHTPAFRSARLVLQAACYCRQRSAWQVGHSRKIPTSRCAWLFLQKARYRGLRSAR